MDMHLTIRHIGEPIDIPFGDILDYIQMDGFTRILVGKYPEKSLDKAVWIEVLETMSEIDDKVINSES